MKILNRIERILAIAFIVVAAIAFLLVAYIRIENGPSFQYVDTSSSQGVHTHV